MELLTSVLAGIFAFSGGILGNVMANDLCVSAARVCTLIIRRAAKRLGRQKDRYEEEWLADLNERETVYAKYQHAIGCYLGAGKIRRQARKVTMHVVYTVPHFGQVDMKLGWYTGLIYYMLKFLRMAQVKDPERLPRFTEIASAAFKDQSIKDWPFEVKIAANGRTIDFTEVGNTVAKHPSILSTVYKKLREKKIIGRR